MIVNLINNDRIETIILIVTYNSRNFVEKLCKSVFEQDYDLSRILLIIVDNNSRDETYECFVNCIEKHSSNSINYILIKLSRNLGFAPANNIGLMIARKYLKSLNGKKILLLNPDTYILRKDFLRNIDVLTRILPIVGFSMVSGTIDVIDSLGGLIDFLGNPQDILCCVRLTDSIGRFLLKTLPKIYYTPYACFAAVAIRGEIIEEIGFLRNDYVIYFEDTEFCLRAWSVNIPVYIYRDSMVWHARGGTQKSKGHLNSNKQKMDEVFLDISYHFSKNQLLLSYAYLGPLRFLVRILIFSFIGVLARHRYLVFSIINSLRMVCKKSIKRKRLPKGLILRNPKAWTLFWALKYLLNYPERSIDEAVSYGVKRSSFEYLKIRFLGRDYRNLGDST